MNGQVICFIEYNVDAGFVVVVVEFLPLYYLITFNIYNESIEKWRQTRTPNQGGNHYILKIGKTNNWINIFLIGGVYVVVSLHVQSNLHLTAENDPQVDKVTELLHWTVHK